MCHICTGFDVRVDRPSLEVIQELPLYMQAFVLQPKKGCKVILLVTRVKEKCLIALSIDCIPR